MKLKEYSNAPSSTVGRILDLVGTNKNVLELGCATGAQSRILTQEMNCVVYGVELNPSAAAKAREYCNDVVIGNLDFIDLEQVLGARKFDVVLCADVLEHLLDPARILHGVKSLIKDGGSIVASIPNVTHAALTFELANGFFTYRDRGLLDDTHIKFFTRDSIVDLFGECGYVISKFDRAIAPPLNTEFKVSNELPEDRLLIDYITARNPEAFTYQFIIKASPAESATVDTVKAQNLAFIKSNLADLARNHEDIIKASRHQLAHYFSILPKAHSELEWLSRNRLFRVAGLFRASIKKLFGFAGRPS